MVMRTALPVHIPLFFLASLASAQTGEVRTGAAALAFVPPADPPRK
jgi:hypothetical protein